MPKVVRIASLFIVSILFCFLSYKLCYFIAEKYFFDKFFYQKSVAHGYWPSYDFQSREFFGLALQQNQKDKLNFGQNDFIIAIIGDSYVWGEGIKNNERFSYLLEKKLNKLRPTKIISIGTPGDSLFNYFKNYQKLIKFTSPQLFIFPLVYNDALIRNYDANGNCFPEPDQDNILQNCSKKYPSSIIIDEPFCQLYGQGYQSNKKSDQQQINKIFVESWHKSWTNPTNLCVLDSSLQKISANNSIFFITEDYENNDSYYSILKKYLSINSKTTILASSGQNILKYKPYFSASGLSSFHISPNEVHPSPLANQMYADILFSEITTNPKWGFIK